MPLFRLASADQRCADPTKSSTTTNAFADVPHLSAQSASTGKRTAAHAAASRPLVADQTPSSMTSSASAFALSHLSSAETHAQPINTGTTNAASASADPQLKVTALSRARPATGTPELASASASSKLARSAITSIKSHASASACHKSAPSVTTGTPLHAVATACQRTALPVTTGTHPAASADANTTLLLAKSINSSTLSPANASAPQRYALTLTETQPTSTPQSADANAPTRKLALQATSSTLLLALRSKDPLAAHQVNSSTQSSEAATSPRRLAQTQPATLTTVPLESASACFLLLTALSLTRSSTLRDASARSARFRHAD